MLFHQKRADYLLALLERLPINSAARILDVGRSPLTNLVLARFPDVTTLGLPLAETLLDKADPIDESRVPHIVFDLNTCDKQESWALPGVFNVVLFNEVIEHLRISPGWVFRYLNALLAPGGFVIVQTPNAVSFGRRARMLIGRNPYVEFAMGGEVGSHHFREYTKAELIRHAKAAGLAVYEHRYVSYFPAARKAIGSLASIFPSLRNGQTVVLAKRAL
jgi:2-polyprenyl-3-methyl-5-hydroxy-6-metoxy-1,4-benzoquinol methylase